LGIEPRVRAHPMFTAVDHERLVAVRALADAALGSGSVGRGAGVAGGAAGRGRSGVG
jgi:hypothetical protein